MDYPKEPTVEECTAKARMPDWYGQPAFACWYPQMGGYVGKCVIILMDDSAPGCFEACVWHDGEFPFSEDDDRGRKPAWIHHCNPTQFVDFGNLVLAKQKELLR